MEMRINQKQYTGLSEGQGRVGEENKNVVCLYSRRKELSQNEI